MSNSSPLRPDAQNLVQMFFERAARLDDTPFLWRKANDKWCSKSWRQVAHEVAALTSALQRLGLNSGDRVMLVSENRPEFCIADLAIMAAGGITVPAYTTNTEADHAHVLADSGAQMVIVSTAKIGKTLLPAVIRAGTVRHLIGMEPLHIGQSGDIQLHDWRALLAVEHVDPQIVAEAADFARNDLACIIYTSGTGGAPRGVMLSHGSILSNCAGAEEIINDFPSSSEIFLSFLPLSHALEHSGGQFFPIWLGAQIYYAESLERLAANIEEVRPTILIVVPRLFEMLRTRIMKVIEGQGAFNQGLMQRALSIGEKKRRLGHLPLRDRPINALLDATVRRKVRARFGGRCKALISGGAPLNPEIGHFFQSLGLSLLQGYGLTEAGPVVSGNRPSVGITMDSVGPPIRGAEVKIAEDGEILVRGEMVMRGYWNQPAETARAIIDGWLHTGDIGHLDDKGRLHITDRKKDIIVNDKGDNISPQKIEGMLTLSPEIFQAIVVGDQRPHLTGLVVPDPDWVRDWAKKHAKPNDLSLLNALPAFHRDIMRAVDRVNAKLSVIEKVRKVSVITEPFTIENEMLTPSIKIRRHKIKTVYATELDALY